MSVGLTVAAATRMRSSPGPGCGAGRSETSSTSGPPSRENVTARMYYLRRHSIMWTFGATGTARTLGRPARPPQANRRGVESQVAQRPRPMAYDPATGGQPMIDVTPNLPEVVTEVRALFERYEQALIDKNVEVLDATFWNSPYTIRYALNEHGYGFSEIHATRVASPLGPGIKERRIRLEILTLGRELATVNLEFKVRGRDLIGRQSQTWVRFPDLGWKVISAHVSTVDAVR